MVKLAAGLTAVLVVAVSMDLDSMVVLPIKVTARLAAVLVVAVHGPGCYSCFHMKVGAMLVVAAGLKAVMVVDVSRPDPYSCVAYEGGSWAGSCAGGGCL